MGGSFKVSATLNFTLCTSYKRTCWFLGLHWSQRQFYTHVGRKSMGPLLSNVNAVLLKALFSYFYMQFQSPLAQCNTDTWICFCISPIYYLGDFLCIFYHIPLLFMSWLVSLESPLSAFWAGFLLSYCHLLLISILFCCCATSSATCPAYLMSQLILTSLESSSSAF